MTGAFTFLAWVYSNNIASEQMIFTNTNATTSGWHIEVYGSKLIMQDARGPWKSSTNAMSSNSRQHVAVVYNNGIVTFYLNGGTNGTGSITFIAPTGLTKKI